MAKHIAWHKMYFGWKRLRTNRKYKDRLFRFLFREKKDLLDLYNAVNESFYTDPNELEIITLDDVIFIKNGQLVVQSTVDNIRAQFGKTVDSYFREVFAC